jgi:hypothetical protein
MRRRNQNPDADRLISVMHCDALSVRRSASAHHRPPRISADGQSDQEMPPMKLKRRQ